MSDPLASKRWSKDDDPDVGSMDGWVTDPDNPGCDWKLCYRCNKRLLRGPAGGIWHADRADAVQCFAMS